MEVINKSSEKVKIDPIMKSKMQELVHQKKLEDPKLTNLLLNFINECMALEITLPNVKFSKVTAYNVFKKSKTPGDWKSMTDEEKAKYQVMANEENFIRREATIKKAEEQAKKKAEEELMIKAAMKANDRTRKIHALQLRQLSVDQKINLGMLPLTHDIEIKDYIKSKLAEKEFSVEESVDYMISHEYSREEALDFVSKISTPEPPRKNRIDPNSRPRYIQDELKEKLNEEELNGWYKAKIIWKH
jgi:acid stress-induced BolA-like protein IbaG/YrbA